MQILIDACVARAAVDAVAAAGHDTDWFGVWDEDPGDAEILRRAMEAGRILVTLDRDFGEIAVVRRHPHCGIIRLVGLASTEQGAACIAALHRQGMCSPPEVSSPWSVVACVFAHRTASGRADGGKGV